MWHSLTLLEDQVPFPPAHDLLPAGNGAQERSLGVDQVAAHAHVHRAVPPLHGVDLRDAPAQYLDLLAPVGELHGKHADPQQLTAVRVGGRPGGSGVRRHVRLHAKLARLSSADFQRRDSRTGTPAQYPEPTPPTPS